MNDPTTGEDVEVILGALRERDVQVGRHIAISAGAVPRFLARMDAASRSAIISFRLRRLRL